MVETLRNEGVSLVLAHPERFYDLLRHPSRIETLHRAGMMLQVDLLSLSGKNGRSSKRFAEELLESGMVDFVASDLHRAQELTDLARALDILAKKDANEFLRLTSTNPRRLLEGRVEEVVRRA